MYLVCSSAIKPSLFFHSSMYVSVKTGYSAANYRPSYSKREFMWLKYLLKHKDKRSFQRNVFFVLIYSQKYMLWVLIKVLSELFLNFYFITEWVLSRWYNTWMCSTQVHIRGTSKQIVFVFPCEKTYYGYLLEVHTRYVVGTH